MWNERKRDKELNIETTGVVNWPAGVNLDYFRTESTLYADLDLFLEEYDLLTNPKLIDFGSGKGRIIYHINNKLDIPATGIEVNTVAFHYLLDNQMRYAEKFPSLAKKISIYEMKAEDYLIHPEDNTFYLFNPFTINIFREILKNIEESLESHPRIVDIIFYYPGFDYTHYLDKHSNFDLIQTIKTPKYDINNRECFKVFRYYP